MILMSRYKGQLHGGKKAKKFGQGPPPPTFRAMLERKGFFLCEVFPNCDYNFGTFDNFGVKNDQKVSHNMIIDVKIYVTVKKFGQGPPLPLFGQC